MRIYTKQIVWTFLGLSFLMSACQKEDIRVYASDERVNFNYTEMNIPSEKGKYNDTLSFDMGFTAEDYVTVNLDFILMGYAKTYEREIGLSITGDKDYVGSVLDIPEKIIFPANQVKYTLPCRILVSDELKEADKVFYLKITDSKDLLAGNRTTICLKASADVPTEWKGDEFWWGNKVEQFFGECSKEKYRFVYSVLKVWDFSNWNGTGFSSSMGDANKFNPAKRLLKAELAKYEEQYGPLIDPDKGRVTFPD